MRQEATVPPLLNLAWEKTGLVDGDPDAREELRVSLVREAAGRSDFAWCLLHIPQMDPKARGLAYAMASWDAANEGFPPRARELLQAAEQDNFIRTDEETARLQAYLAASEQRLGREKEAQRHLASILDVRGRGYAKALVQAAQWARNMPGAMGETKDFAPEAVPELVKSLDAVLRDEKQDHARKRQALLLAEKIVAKADPANGAQGWAQLALSAHAAGLLGEAAVCSRRSKDLAMSLDPRTEQYGISLAAAARALARCGDREDAQRCLDLAAAKPGVVALFFQPPVLMALAEAHQAMRCHQGGRGLAQGPGGGAKPSSPEGAGHQCGAGFAEPFGGRPGAHPGYGRGDGFDCEGGRGHGCLTSRLRAGGGQACESAGEAQGNQQVNQGRPWPGEAGPQVSFSPEHPNFGRVGCPRARPPESLSEDVAREGNIDKIYVKHSMTV